MEDEQGTVQGVEAAKACSRCGERPRLPRQRWCRAYMTAAERARRARKRLTVTRSLSASRTTVTRSCSVPESNIVICGQNAPEWLHNPGCGLPFRLMSKSSQSFAATAAGPEKERTHPGCPAVGGEPLQEGMSREGKGQVWRRLDLPLSPAFPGSQSATLANREGAVDLGYIVVHTSGSRASSVPKRILFVVTIFRTARGTKTPRAPRRPPTLVDSPTEPGPLPQSADYQPLFRGRALSLVADESGDELKGSGGRGDRPLGGAGCAAHTSGSPSPRGGRIAVAPPIVGPG